MATVRIGPRPRRWPVVVIGVLVALTVVFTALSGFVIDLMWYREIGHTSVFWTQFWTKAIVGLIFGFAFFALLLVNLVVARRIRPTTRVLTPEQEAIERIRDLSEPYLRWLLPAGAAVLGLLVGLGVTGEWQTYLLWRNSAGVTFGNPEPLFGRDPAFYIFSLPWLRFLQGWLFSALVGVTVLSGIAHVLWGGIRPQALSFADKVVPAARAHLSVLLGLIMLVKAWGYWLGRFDLLTSSRGVVQGASHTDVNAHLPALNFLVLVAVVCAVLFFLNIRLRQWSLPVIAVGLLALVSVLLGSAYPAFVQQFRVRPNEQVREALFIEHNIAATRRAFGLEDVVAQERDVSGPLDAEQIEDNSQTVSNIRLWRGDPILKENFQSLQRIRQYYDFEDIDVDRYVIDGEQRVLMVSPREIAQNGIPAGGQTWQNRHLAYTHGFGMVAAQVNAATAEGQASLVLQNLPPVGQPAMSQPRIYYGEGNDVPFVVVGTTTQELDYEGAPENEPYQGSGGIRVGNLLTRGLFAWQFRDYNLLVSSAITADSRILIYRDIETRVRKPVPFLGFDNDPYFAVVGGRGVWIWDAYTASNEYPYSESVDIAEATDGLIAGRVNYLRNPVKAVMDAYDGSITYYADLDEPVLSVWASAFPGLFTPMDEAPDELVAHFRYPENLFQVQAHQYSNYHVQEPVAFYQKRDFWAVPEDPTDLVETGAVGATMRPYYQLIRLPGEPTEDFELVLPFVPEGRVNMVAWMAASSDPENYGRLTVYRFPEGRNIEGPSQVFARINQDARFSSERTLLDQAGSNVLFGDFLVIPIDDSFLYVQPAYVRAKQGLSIPELNWIVIVNGSGGEISIGNTLQEALAVAVEGIAPPDGGNGGGEPPPVGPITEQIEALLVQALVHFEAADEALRTGNLATYQLELARAQDLIEEAEQLAARSAGAEGAEASPSPAPTASP